MLRQLRPEASRRQVVEDRLTSHYQGQGSRTFQRHAVGSVVVVAAEGGAGLEWAVEFLLCCQWVAAECAACAEGVAAGSSDLLAASRACADRGRSVQEAVHEGSHAQVVVDRSPCRNLAEADHADQKVGSHTQAQRRECRGSHEDRQGLEIVEAAVDL